MRQSRLSLSILCQVATAQYNKYDGGASGDEGYVSRGRDGGSSDHATHTAGGATKGCDEGCVRNFLMVPVYIVLIMWVSSTVVTLPDWVRQCKYVTGLQEAMRLHRVPCQNEATPPSGNWEWQSVEQRGKAINDMAMMGASSRTRAGVIKRTLSFTFSSNGTFAGEVLTRTNDCIIQDGRFNSATGEFVWEEVQVQKTQPRCALLRSLGLALRFGPLFVFSPLACQKRRDGKRFENAPRTFVTAIGKEHGNGQWTLQGTSVTYDRKTRGCIFDLAVGTSSTLGGQIGECSSPTVSPSVSPRRQRAVFDSSDIEMSGLGVGGVDEDMTYDLEEAIDEDPSSPLVSPQNSPSRQRHVLGSILGKTQDSSNS